jgi:hypothetical protein
MLWNAKHPRHFNKILRNDAWEELASELNTTAEECRKKMTGLVACFTEKGEKKNEEKCTHNAWKYRLLQPLPHPCLKAALSELTERW